MSKVFKRKFTLSFSAVLVTVVAVVSVQSTRDKSSDKTLYPGNFQVVTPPLPAKLDFAGEPVPFEFFDVRESLDKELMVNMYWHSQTLLLLKKSPRFFHTIVPIIKSYNIPEDFKYMPVVESGLDNVVSPSNARGYWQLLESTARDYGLEINKEVDERYHLKKSTHAACKYLLESYRKYNNWTLTAASYNNGRRGVDRQLNKQQEENFYDILYNDETSRYIYRLLAFKCIFENPEHYGFQLNKEDYYYPVPVMEIPIDSTIIDLADFARIQGSTYKMLKIFNPWLRGNKLTVVNGETYIFELPEKDARSVKHIQSRYITTDSVYN